MDLSERDEEAKGRKGRDVLSRSVVLGGRCCICGLSPSWEDPTQLCYKIPPESLSAPIPLVPSAQ